jgi:hypothetical protein
MDFSLHLTSEALMWHCSEKSILAEQINDSMFILYVILQTENAWKLGMKPIFEDSEYRFSNKINLFLHIWFNMKF